MEDWARGMPTFEVLVSTILSQSTTVANERRGMEGLRDAFGTITPEKLARRRTAEIEQAIYHAGLSRQKAPRIRAIADRLVGMRSPRWEAILRQDIVGFGQHVRESFEAQIAMFPNMMKAMVAELIEQNRPRALGWKLSGAGGGGYLILVADRPIENAIQIIVRKKEI